MKRVTFQVEKNAQVENERELILNDLLKRLFKNPKYYLNYFRSNKDPNKIGNQETESLLGEIQHAKELLVIKNVNQGQPFLRKESAFIMAELLDKSYELEEKAFDEKNPQNEMQTYYEVFFKHVEDAKSLRNEFFQHGITHFTSKEYYKKIYLNMPKADDSSLDSYSMKFTQAEWNKVMDNYNKSYYPGKESLGYEAAGNDARPSAFLTM